jgi:intein/homing endonuclease/glycosyltransferase involved in cell wall biosynthesis
MEIFSDTKTSKETIRMSKKPVKLLAYSDSSSTSTGFGIVSKYILSYLYETGKYQIDQLAINFPSRFHNVNAVPWSQIPSKILDPSDPYGKTLFLKTVLENDYDVVWILNDTFVVYDIIDDLKKITKLKSDRGSRVPKFIFYYPVDANVPREVVPFLNFVDAPVVYNRYGLEQTRRVSPNSAAKTRVIPHGVNANVFIPLGRDEAVSLKEKYLKGNASKFVFLNVNRNSERKQLSRTILAFSEFKKKVPDSVLLLHTQPIERGISKTIDLFPCLRDLNLSPEVDVLFPKNYEPGRSFPESVLNDIYNLADCFITSDCFVGETLIQVPGGYKAIKDIKIGDSVACKDGSINRVYRTLNRPHDDELFHLRVSNLTIPLNVTGEHPFVYISQNQYKNLKYHNKRPEHNWKLAKELKIGDVLVCPVKPDYTVDKYVVDLSSFASDGYWEIDSKFLYPSRVKDGRTKYKIHRQVDFCHPDMARLLGYYISEGSLNKRNIQFSLHKEEGHIVEDIHEILNKHIFATDRSICKVESNKDKSVSVIACCKLLGERFQNLCGDGAWNKHIPGFLMRSSRKAKLELLRGLFLGDGTISNKTVSYKTVNNRLAMQIRDLLLEFGITPTLNIDDNSAGYGRNDIYAVKVYHVNDIIRAGLFDGENLEKRDRTNINRYIYLDNGFVYMPIRSICSSHYQGTVYNLSVENDNTYIAGGCAVHNCGEGWGLCVSPDTSVNTDVGLKTIRKLNIGDKVLSEDGLYHPVIAKTTRQVNGVLEIKAVGCPPVKVTPEHPLLYLKRRSNTYDFYTKTERIVPEWIRADTLRKGDSIAILRPEVRENDSLGADPIVCVDSVEYDHNVVAGKFAFTPITSITECNDTQEVMDISVQDVHSFVGNGILLHNSVHESMSAGTPVVAPDNTSRPEILGKNSERGYLYPCTDYWQIDNVGYRPFGRIEDIVKQMMDVYDAGNKYDNPKSALARAWAEEYSWKNICPQWDILIESLLNPSAQDLSDKLSERIIRVETL